MPKPRCPVCQSELLVQALEMTSSPAERRLLGRIKRALGPRYPLPPQGVRVPKEVHRR